MNMSEYAMGGGSLLMVILWVLIIVVVFLLVSGWARRSNKNSDGESDMGILKKRFAKGEIDADQYEEMRRLLSDGK